MTKEELLAEIEKQGGKVEPIKRTCQFQNFDECLHNHCKQIKDNNHNYMAFMGLSGGLGAYCWGSKSPYVVDGVICFKNIPPCPYRGDDAILGYKVLLPAD